MGKQLSIVITCHGEAQDLPIMLGCLERQMQYGVAPHSRLGVPIPNARVVGPCPVTREIIVVCDGPFGGTPSDALRADKLIECPKQGGCGHHTRQYGLDAAYGDWLVFTNADNYFVAGFLDRIERHLIPGNGLVYWQCVNNLWLWTNGGGSRLERGRIDLSCAAVATEVAKKVGFPYEAYDGDFDYLRDCQLECRRRKLAIQSIERILCVHN